MDAVQKLPIGIQDFESLRKDGYLYVDKKSLGYKLVSDGVYNPFSLLNTLSKQKYGSYWFETGTPT